MINAVEVIYDNTAEILYEITVIYVKTAEPDPYSSTSSGTLLDQFKQDAGRIRQGVVPVVIPFPELGPSKFLAAELTPEAHAPALDLEIRSIGGRR